MLITGIKSRPTYSPLTPDLRGRVHLLVGQGTGGTALLRFLGEMPPSAEVRVLYAAESLSGHDLSEPLREQVGSRLCRTELQAEAIAELDRILSECTMGTRLYIAGSESFIGSAVQVALRYNLQADEMQREHSGTAARRVYCIHCRGTVENVTTNIVPCGQCGRHLLVRDHYSRRLAAYMGVMADAESPGQLPPIREVFAWNTQKPSPSS